MAVRWRHRAEYVLLRSSTAILNVLPYRVALAFAAGLAALVYAVARRRTAEARRRIAQVFPDKSPRAVAAIARRSLRGLFFSAVETVRFLKLDRAWIARHIDVGNFPEQVEAHLKPGQGALLVIPHMGNWELSGLVASRRGHAMFFLVGRQRNPLTERFMNRARSVTGVDIIIRDENAPRQVLRKLRAGKIFGVLPDVRLRTPGIPVRFLGCSAEMPGGIVMFARHTGVPLFVGHVRREGWTRHVWEFHPPVWADPAADKEAEAHRLMQYVADCFTDVIRRYPDQYFWYNRRWILEPRV